MSALSRLSIIITFCLICSTNIFPRIHTDNCNKYSKSLNLDQSVDCLGIWRMELDSRKHSITIIEKLNVK